MLLHHWKGAATRELVDRGTLLMLDDHLRSRLLGDGTSAQPKKRGRKAAAPPVGLPSLLGKTVKWKGRRSAKGGILAAQTALPGSRMQVQAVAQATRDETYLDEFKKVAESLVVARP